MFVFKLRPRSVGPGAAWNEWRGRSVIDVDTWLLVLPLWRKQQTAIQWLSVTLSDLHVQRTRCMGMGALRIPI